MHLKALLYLSNFDERKYTIEMLKNILFLSKSAQLNLYNESNFITAEFKSLILIGRTLLDYRSEIFLPSLNQTKLNKGLLILTLDVMPWLGLKINLVPLFSFLQFLLDAISTFCMSFLCCGSIHK